MARVLDSRRTSPRAAEAGKTGSAASAWPDGVALHPLRAHADARGVFTEVFRGSWGLGVEPVQWNVVSSRPGVLRGAHVHLRHDDYWILLAGRAHVGLRDARPGSRTEGRTALVEMRGDRPTAVVIPHGVVHGFCFHEPSVHLYAVTEYFDPADELACRWDDPELGIPWPVERPLLSERDAGAGSFRALRERLAPRPPGA